MASESQGTVSVEGAELHYSTRGSGAVCLVLSAVGTTAYERMTPTELSARLKLVYVDVRGGGMSTGDAADLSFDVLASDLEAIRHDLGVERVAVLGHSILGMLAVEYARRAPGSVSHLILVGTPPTGDLAALAAAGASYFEEDASDERKRILKDNLAALPENASPGQTMLAQTPMRFYDARLDAAPLFADSKYAPALMQQVMGRLAPGWSATGGSEPLQVPVFVALGRHDYVVPHVLWDGVAEALPNATVRIFERSGHQPFFEEPEAFAEAVTEWMASEEDGR